jgi:biopolymer transport protein TolQ
MSGLELFKLLAMTGPVGKGIVVLLGVVSLVCWAVILEKALALRRGRRETSRFLAHFNKHGLRPEVRDLAGQLAQSSEARLFVFAHAELLRMVNDEGSPYRLEEGKTGVPEVVELELLEGRVYDMQALSDVISRYTAGIIPLEINRLEQRLNILATTGSVAPFIGLFGTVWGILIAFHNIGLQQSASLATVAPGISEALITTVAGLVAAIPAVIAYNVFNRMIRRVAVELECFAVLLVVRLESRGLQ